MTRAALSARNASPTLAGAMQTIPEPADPAARRLVRRSGRPRRARVLQGAKVSAIRGMPSSSSSPSEAFMPAKS